MKKTSVPSAVTSCLPVKASVKLTYSSASQHASRQHPQVRRLRHPEAPVCGRRHLPPRSGTTELDLRNLLDLVRQVSVHGVWRYIVLRKRTASLRMMNHRNVSFALRNSSPEKRWVAWSVYVNFIGCAYDSGGIRKVSEVARRICCTNESKLLLELLAITTQCSLDWCRYLDHASKKIVLSTSLRRTRWLVKPMHAARSRSVGLSGAWL